MRVVAVVYPNAGARRRARSRSREREPQARAERDEQQAYEIEIVARTAGPVRTTAASSSSQSAPSAKCAPIDTLPWRAATEPRTRFRDRELVFRAPLALHARRVASVCTGSFLAEAGLLDGRRATTHWTFCSELARRYPSVTVDPEPIFVRDGKY
jgi:transcriptional regulator GlxA family with amidase domain